MGNLDLVLKSINTKFKSKIANTGMIEHTYKKIPFSSPCMNYLTRGGLPRGRLVEFYGIESGGKTSTTLDIVGNAQKLFKQEWLDEIAELEAMEKRNKTQDARLNDLQADGPQKVLFVDAEWTLDIKWAKKLGVNVDELIIIQPDNQSAEEIFHMIEDITDSGGIGLAVLDSIGVLLSQQEMDKTVEEKTMAGISSALTRFGKDMTQKIAKNNVLFIGINQERDVMNSPCGAKKTVGGKAWKFLCSYRIRFNKGRFIDEVGKELTNAAENVAGNMVEVSVIKNKVTMPDRRLAKYTLKYKTGIDVYDDTFTQGLLMGLIEGQGYYTFVFNGETYKDETDKPLKIQGKANVVQYFKDNPEFFNDLYEGLNEIIIK